MLARGRFIGWFLIGAAGLFPIAGAVALRVEPQVQAAQEAAPVLSPADAQLFQQGARDERDKLNQWRAINGTSGVGYGPFPDAALYKDNPYLMGAYTELKAQADGESAAGNP